MISLDKMNLVMTVEYGKGVKGFESYYFMAYIDLGMAVCLMNKNCFVITKQYHALQRFIEEFVNTTPMVNDQSLNNK